MLGGGVGCGGGTPKRSHLLSPRLGSRHLLVSPPCPDPSSGGDVRHLQAAVGASVVFGGGSARGGVTGQHWGHPCVPPRRPTRSPWATSPAPSAWPCKGRTRGWRSPGTTWPSPASSSRSSGPASASSRRSASPNRPQTAPKMSLRNFPNWLGASPTRYLCPQCVGIVPNTSRVSSTHPQC